MKPRKTAVTSKYTLDISLTRLIVERQANKDQSGGGISGVIGATWANLHINLILKTQAL